MSPTAVTLLAAGLGLLLAFAGFSIVSMREREPRAATLSIFLGVAMGVPVTLAAFAAAEVRVGVLIALAVLALAALILFLLPAGRTVAPGGRPSRVVDERTIMFARKRLRPGTPEFDEYYEMHPEDREGDDRTRTLPGLLSLKAAKAEPVAFASADASFGVTGALRDAVDGPVNPTQHEQTTAEATAMVKRLAHYYGAVDVGVAEIQPYHVYSHVGRGSGTWGESIELGHRYAIAFSVEMDHGVMRKSPEAPVVAESARQYVNSGLIAIQLATVIRTLGHAARAHIDGNYRVIAPLVARDAGLGEIGRMGLLMTPGLGPRVRLGVVTTALPLIPDAPGDDASMIDFCATCKKCATNCPSQSIPTGDREPIDGGLRWVIDADSCFRYWNAIGTDCARCMTVCPYSHPDNAAHNLVRWAIRRSGTARRTMLWMDDLFYGRRPPTRGVSEG